MPEAAHASIPSSAGSHACWQGAIGAHPKEGTHLPARQVDGGGDRLELVQNLKLAPTPLLLMSNGKGSTSATLGRRIVKTWDYEARGK